MARKTVLRRRIDAIPGNDGWWHTDGAETFHFIAQQLIEKGFAEEDAIDLLASAFGAVANEFGS